MVPIVQLRTMNQVQPCMMEPKILPAEIYCESTHLGILPEILLW